jgi:hypothetical protein
MKMDRIRKRLAEIEKEHEQKTPIKFVTRFSSSADSTAYYLTMEQIRTMVFFVYTGLKNLLQAMPLSFDGSGNTGRSK